MASASFLPVENGTTSFWLSQQTGFSRYRHTKEIPAEVDTLIIGSGYAGTSVAHYMLKMDPTADVAMFEARNVCSGATGRNGGHVKPYFYRSYERYETTLGEVKAAEIVESELEHLFLLKKLSEDENIDCDYFLTRACDVYPRKGDPKIAKHLKSYDMMMKNPYVKESTKQQVQLYYGDAAKIISKVDTDVCITYPAGSCWPWKLMTGLLKKCVDKGLKLHANTMVTQVIQRKDGKWVVSTKDRGETICKNVVFCTNGYTKGLLSEFNDVITPEKNVICRIVPTDKENIPHLSNTYCTFTSGWDEDYIINRPDGSIIVGGHDEIMLDFEKEGNEALAKHYDTVDDSFVDEGTDKVFNGDYMGNLFSTWKNTPSEVSHYWSGIMGFTNDFLPYVGELDCIGKKGAYICAGFHGHGMPRVLMCGKAIATSLVENKPVQEIEYTCPTAFFVTKKRLDGPDEHREELLNGLKFDS